VARSIAEINPDVIVINLGNPNRDVLEHMFQLSRAVKRPIAMFVDRSDRASIEAAVEAGVSAYVVDGLKQERVKPILDMAISRFNAFSRLTRELEEARSELEDRKLIERAKGILMKSKGLSEEAPTRCCARRP
jgi:response regulator NasT